MKMNRQKGFTLTELMITTGLSLSVIAAVLVGYVGTYTSSVTTLGSSKLNHELNTLMGLMSNDIRRAGYWGALDASDDPLGNPFNRSGETALTVFDGMNTNNPAGPTGEGSCILFAYDLNSDGDVNAEELTGFRLNDGVVQIRSSGVPGSAPSCTANADVWEDLTDDRLVNVTALNFDLSASACLNIDDPAAEDCYVTAPDSGDVTVETRQVGITVEGSLRDDAFVRFTQSHTVRVRNELIREH